MKDLNLVIQKIDELRGDNQIRMTLLAVCPNSEAVLEAAVSAAAKNN